jgi:hypothetical protein
MSQKKPSKKSANKSTKKPITELPDDQAIRKLFPREVLDRVKDEIGPKHKGK